MPAARRIVIVANSKSGSTGSDSLDQLATALSARGATVELLTTEQPAQLPAIARKACESKPDIAVAFGGDGTVNTLANALAGSTVPMGIAPRGTFNYVARQYGLPDAPEDIAELLTTGTAQPIAAGEVNGKLFLNNCSFGLYTDVIEARERHKAAWGRYRLVAVVSALATALRSTARLPLKLVGAEDGVRHHGRASLFFAGVNPRQFSDSGFEIAEAVAAGALGFVVVDTISAGRILQMLWGAAAGKVESLQHVTAFTDIALRAEVLRRLRPLKVVIDGELLRLASPLQFKYRAAALQLMLPAAAATQTSR
ncbi:MAG: diacylglycerol kinase family protein [Pseudomonadota bacterium]